MNPRNGVHVSENVSTGSGIPTIAGVLTSPGEEEQPDDDRAGRERDPGDDVEEGRHS
jgi:hypothetical protein